MDLLTTAGSRVLLNVAAETAAAVIDAVGAAPGCLRIAAAGSLRRAAESIGDVDVLAAAHDSAPLMAALTAMPEAAEVIASGPTKTSIRTDAGPAGRPAGGAARLLGRGAAVLHRLAAAQRARSASWPCAGSSSCPSTACSTPSPASCIVSRTEEEVYERLGLAWIPPVLREDTGEVAAARAASCRMLVDESDIRGDLHTHTNLTDGAATLDEMVTAAEARGYEYYAITDHAPNLVMQRMTDEKMLAQREQVRDARRPAGRSETAQPTAPERQQHGMVLLHGTELNIAPDGSVDWPADFLAGFDICVASVHSHFDLPRREMTRRFIAACENPYVNVIGHPLTRKIGRRPPVDVDLPELFRACARTGTALEVNSHPARLDLPSAHIKAARDAGVKFAVDTDAHSCATSVTCSTASRPRSAAGSRPRTTSLRLAAGPADRVPAQEPLAVTTRTIVTNPSVPLVDDV